MKRNNQRTCLYSNKQYDKSQLVRLVTKDKRLVVDVNQKMLGRGYWLRLTKQCLDDPKLITILSKKTKSSIDEKLINKLKELI